MEDNGIVGVEPVSPRIIYLMRALSTSQRFLHFMSLPITPGGLFFILLRPSVASPGATRRKPKLFAQLYRTNLGGHFCHQTSFVMGGRMHLEEPHSSNYTLKPAARPSVAGFF
jgi:hypothetical protein